MKNKIELQEYLEYLSIPVNDVISHLSFNAMTEKILRMFNKVVKDYNHQIQEKDNQITYWKETTRNDYFIQKENFKNIWATEFELEHKCQSPLFQEDFDDLILCRNCDTLQEYCYMRDDKDNYHEYYRKVQFKNDDYSKYDLLESKEEKENG